jgi:1-aminocyclopropane-1-carboxylate deaminase/D-cysteine desulfhydrase-like pyridoxal-dependent ACC family enzyme
MAGTAAAGVGVTGYALSRANRVGTYPRDEVLALASDASNPLFDRYPGLRGVLPWRPLGSLPTPVEELPVSPGAASSTGSSATRRPGTGRLFVKRDDRSSARYGGNKPRKLEYLLAEASLRRAGTLVTLGAIGSNHALATTLHGRALGFEVWLALHNQPVTPHVTANLMGMLHAGARIRHAGSPAGGLLAARQACAEQSRTGARPYFIMPGGTMRLGNVGHVSAALELARQVSAGELPAPDCIFVAAGTCGTVAGLLVGLQLAGLPSRLMAVRVYEPFLANALAIGAYAADLGRYLRRLDPAIPEIDNHRDRLVMVTDHLGAGYGMPTAAALDAVEQASPHVRLETTYTAKAFAACLEYCRSAGRDQNVLFWHTWNSAPFATTTDPSGLPESLTRVILG